MNTVDTFRTECQLDTKYLYGINSIIGNVETKENIVFKSISPILIDFKSLRPDRQKINNKLLFDAIKNKNIENIHKFSNENELNRVLDETNISFNDLIIRCSNDDFCNIILSGRISKKSNRQGTLDENTQIEVCKKIANEHGINIQNLNTIAYRPHKNGEIITPEMMKMRNISKDECLKSFDGQITGKMNGWLFAKIVFGSGGHQDNVFEEADNLCKWVVDFHKVVDFHNVANIYVILIDTDLDKKMKILQNKYQEHKNLIITDHYGFQKYIIDNYILD